MPGWRGLRPRSPRIKQSAYQPRDSRPFLSPGIFDTGARRIDQLGIILGWLGKPLQEDPEGTLRAVAETGYRYLEFGGTLGLPPERLEQLLKELDLVPIAGGTAMAGLQDDLSRHIDGCLRWEKEYLVCYWPWMHSALHFGGLDEVRRVAEQLNGIGQTCREQGLKFAFHNHDKEFALVEGRRVFDVLLDDTHPDLVTVELDIAWMIKGGGDPVDYFHRYPGRFELFHIKDLDTTPAADITTVGKGSIDFRRILANDEDSGVRYYIVEQDRAPAPLRNMREAYAYLTRLDY